MIIDVVVIIVLLFSAAISFWRGFIREVLTIAGIVGGIVAAYVGGPLLIPHMRGWFGVVDGEEPQMLFGPITYEMAADVTSYLTILLVVIFILSVISHFISEFVKNIGLGALDRTMGVVFGLARGILLLGLIYMPISYIVTDEQKETYLVPTRSYVYLDATAQLLMKYMPGEVEQALKDSAQDASEKVESANTMREQLQDMKLLGSDENAQKPVETEPVDPATGTNKPAGYSDGFRDDMNKLIEDSLKSGSQSGAQPQPAQQEQQQQQQ